MGLLKVVYFSNGLGLPSGEDFVNKIFPNIWAFLVQFIAFIIMVIIVLKFAYKPVHKFIEERRNYVSTNLKEAKEKNDLASISVQKAKSNLAESQKQAIVIIQDAQKEANKQKEMMIEEAKMEIASKKLQAKEDIKKVQEKAIKEIHDDVVSLAFEATKSILDREVNQNDNKKMVDDFVKDLIEKR